MSVVYALFIQGTIPLSVPTSKEVEEFIKYVDNIPNCPYCFLSGAMDVKNKVFLIKLMDLQRKGFNDIHRNFWKSKFSLCPQEYLDYYTKRIGLVIISDTFYHNLNNIHFSHSTTNLSNQNVFTIYLDLSFIGVSAKDLKGNSWTKKIVSISINDLQKVGKIQDVNPSLFKPALPNNESKWDSSCLFKVFSVFIKNTLPSRVPTSKEAQEFFLYLNGLKDSRFTINSAALDKTNNLYLVKFNLRLICAMDLIKCFLKSKFSLCSHEYASYYTEKVGFALMTYPECLYDELNKMKIEQLIKGNVIGTSVRNGIKNIFLSMNCDSLIVPSIGSICVNIKSFWVPRSILKEHGRIENVDFKLFEPVTPHNSGFRWDESCLKDREIIFPSLESNNKNVDHSNLNLPV